MVTERRPSLRASLYSCSIATLMMIAPVSVDIGPVTARNPSMLEPSSFSKSTCCPGSGTRGGLPLPNVICLPLASLVSQEQDIPTARDPPPSFANEGKHLARPPTKSPNEPHPATPRIFPRMRGPRHSHASGQRARPGLIAYTPGPRGQAFHLAGAQRERG